MSPSSSAAELTSEIIKDRTLTAIALQIQSADYASQIMSSVSYISGSPTPPTIILELTISPFLGNMGANLHGGAASTILDNCTSTALHVLSPADPGSFGSVSRTLTVTYLRPVPVGTRVRVESEVVTHGRTTANIRGTIRTLDGKVCVSCVHDKVIIPKEKL